MRPFIHQDSPPAPVISDLRETGLIERISSILGKVSPNGAEGIGDDCAVFHPSPGRKQILTVDSVTWGAHFDKKVSARDAGAKLVKRNLSDIAAMGGVPRVALLNLLAGPDLLVTWLDEFIKGVRGACLHYGLLIVGGDVSSLPHGQFSASLSLLGELASEAILRSSGKITDQIYVTGTLGGTILKKHFAFTPRLAEGQWLASRGDCTAMLDLTDGLAKDLKKLVPAGASALLNLAALPISNDAINSSTTSGMAPEFHAMSDGEDYELCFSLSSKSDPASFERDWTKRFPDLPVTQIGMIAEFAGATVCDNATQKEITLGEGYQHFSQL